jgi:hypothetical protein
MSDSEYDISSADDEQSAAASANVDPPNPPKKQLAEPTQPTPQEKPNKEKPNKKQLATQRGLPPPQDQQLAQIALKENAEKVKKVRKSRAKNTPVSDFQQVKARDEATLENTKLIMSLVQRIEFLDKKLDSATNGVQAKRAAEIQSNLHQAKAMFAKFSR